MKVTLLSRAERSGFAETSTYEDVLLFLEALAAASPLVRLETLGVTGDGRGIPLAVVSDPPVDSPAAARALGRPVAFVLANIHAGEVEGKEAAQHLLRRVATGDLASLARRLVLLVAPIYNADGNERLGPVAEHRPGQNGPARVGVRTNAAGLDLNRDHMKLESPEARGLVTGVYRRWDPHLTIDCHATNGSYHGYALTYAPPLSPNAHPAPVEYVRSRLLPAATRVLEGRGVRTFHYGNFDDPARPTESWRTFDHRPRFGNSYVGLRGRLCVLSEAYVYDPFRRRVEATEAFLEALLAHVAGDAAAATAACAAADRSHAGGGHGRPVGTRFDFAPPYARRLLARAEPLGPDRAVEAEVRDAFVATASVERPRGYVLEAGLEPAARLARLHGLRVDPVERGERLPVESCRLVSRRREAEAFQGHRTVAVEVVAARREVHLPAGGWRVSLAQPLGDLAAYLLDPESDDGVVTWNLLDAAIDALEPGSPDAWLPIHRLR